jgi:hypothetical protein
MMRHYGKQSITHIIFICMFFLMITGCTNTKDSIKYQELNYSETTVLTTPSPGLEIEGIVTMQDGTPLSNVRIMRSFAAYDGVQIATTDKNGFYKSLFVEIPGDEMVTVWAEIDGYEFSHSINGYTFDSNSYFWRHYYGYEYIKINFIAKRTR